MTGPDTGMLQAMDQHQEQQGEKSGLGLGHGDSIATITDGMKWFLGSLPEGALVSFLLSLFEGLLSGINLGVLFGKSGNMFGIKILEKLAEFFGGGGEDGGGEGGAPQDEGDAQAHGENRPEDYPYVNDDVAQRGAGLGGAHDDGDHHPSQSFDPGPSPSHGDDHGHGVSH